ncbi:ZinT family metal-binding protein [Roseibium aestuarii]|uniref:ZinT family metal-binding protein n=1 Tax=Roseibium aestuarii TaxID=2600299 RepID=A0ABW4JZU4_9HYPH|nr:metal-binding protein ZinT [Roseibium aestuarii]
MNRSPLPSLLALVLAAGLTAPALADGAKDAAHTHGTHQGHSHGQSDSERQIYKGYFEDSQIQPRTLADWQGDWQSVHPYLLDGTLDPVMAHKAEHGSMSADEYRAYYDTGYATDVDRIVIDGDRFTFHSKAMALSATYAADGFEVLTYKKGNRGVRYIFRKVEGDAGAPGFVQFSDHKISPSAADHYHLYWGDDRAALLEEVTNWPTYYPSALSGAEIVSEMLEH